MTGGSLFAAMMIVSGAAEDEQGEAAAPADADDMRSRFSAAPEG